jgi:predicted transcriptional regulator
MSHKIKIRKIITPPPGSLKDDIDYICRSFGYFSQRDKNCTAGRIFRLIVKETAGEEEGLTSDEIAEKLDLSRGTIVYHLNNFIESGLIVRKKNTYKLRSASLQKSIEEIKSDIERILEEMMKIADEIDSQLGNYYR